MTADEFRSLALSLPDTEEGAHMNHADFRIGGKIFATLIADETWGMVKLPLEEQNRCARDYPSMFEPFDNAWGRQGATKVHLSSATEAAVQQALFVAWKHVAAKRFKR